jgi:4-hydroxy-tetrahydrodipicolinate reductase
VRINGLDAPWSHGDITEVMDVEIRLTVPLERMGETSPAFTANRAVNAVPAACGAPPGIRTTVDLPHIIAVLAT